MTDHGEHGEDRGPEKGQQRKVLKRFGPDLPRTLSVFSLASLVKRFGGK